VAQSVHATAMLLVIGRDTETLLAACREGGVSDAASDAIHLALESQLVKLLGGVMRVKATLADLGSDERAEAIELHAGRQQSIIRDGAEACDRRGRQIRSVDEVAKIRQEVSMLEDVVTVRAVPLELFLMRVIPADVPVRGGEVGQPNVRDRAPLEQRFGKRSRGRA